MHLSLGTRLAQPPATSYCLNTATICMLTTGVMHTNWLKVRQAHFDGHAGLQLCPGEAQLSPVPYLDSEPNLLWNIQQLIREVVPLELHKSQANLLADHTTTGCPILQYTQKSSWTSLMVELVWELQPSSSKLILSSKLTTTMECPSGVQPASAAWSTKKGMTVKCHPIKDIRSKESGEYKINFLYGIGTRNSLKLC